VAVEKNLLQPVVRIVYNARNGGFVRLPYEIDLSHPSSRNGQDRIVGYESPDKWDIRPEMFL